MVLQLGQLNWSANLQALYESIMPPIDVENHGKGVCDRGWNASGISGPGWGRFTFINNVAGPARARLGTGSGPGFVTMD